MKFAVIGSNSFSGASFVDHLLSAGHEVVGMSRSKEPLEIFLPYRHNKNLSSFHFLQLDLNHDLDRMIGVIEEFQAEYVVNFASQSMVAESWENPDHWFQTNAVATVKLHDRLRKYSGLKKYVHISTPEVYGTCSGNVTEDAPINPSTPYAVSRAAADMSLMTFHGNYAFPVVFTRASNVFGPSQQLYRIVPRTILFIRLGMKLQLHGGGHSVRSFIHIRDVSEGTLQVALHAHAPEIYHLSTIQKISIRSLVEMICGRMDVKFSDHVEIVDERPGKDAAYLLDSTRARQKLGWADHVTLEQGIDETVCWVDENLEELRKQPLNYIHKP